jgi:hypothetical protein
MCRQVNRQPRLTHCIVCYMLFIHKDSIHIYKNTNSLHITYGLKYNIATKCSFMERISWLFQASQFLELNTNLTIG